MIKPGWVNLGLLARKALSSEQLTLTFIQKEYSNQINWNTFNYFGRPLCVGTSQVLESLRHMDQTQVCMARSSDVITTRRLRICCHAGRINRIKVFVSVFYYANRDITSPKNASRCIYCLAQRTNRARDRKFVVGCKRVFKATETSVHPCSTYPPPSVSFCCSAAWSKVCRFIYVNGRRRVFFKKQFYSPLRQQPVSRMRSRRHD